ncbi:MAG: ShlB/FhaC/HecB family hemolysin secretion/activation protein [Chlorobiaceae bacterium]|nr:ShlB/FhaC/HecB family hemolysin secretion/activation protein [Chlorobiaceae bacterium]
MTPSLYAVILPDASLPDAGSILREQLPQRQLLPDQLPNPEKEKTVAPVDETALRVLVKGFTFKGNEGIVSESELKDRVAGSIGKNLSFGDLQILTEKLTAGLKEKGWFLSRAYLPKQDITSGIILIEIEQGKSDGSIHFNLEKGARIRMGVLHSLGDQSVAPGQTLNEQGFERSVLLMNDLPGVNAKASLVQGSAPGTSRVDVAVTEGPLLSAIIMGDNQGNRYTGTWRANVAVSVNDLSGYGDKLTLTGTETEGMRDGKIAYGFPVLFDGLRGNVAYSAMHYKLGRELAVFGYAGKSRAIEAGLSYPILRGRNGSVMSSFNYGYRKFEDDVSGVTYRERESRYISLGLNGDRYDSVFGGGYNAWSVGMTTGEMNPLMNFTPISLTSGLYSRFNITMSRIQRIADRATLNVSWTAQLAAQNLDSSEKFSLGGPYGVRAYPLGEASGDQAQLINVDFRYNLPVEALGGGIQISGFFDAGQIRVERDRITTFFGTASERNVYWLQGAGVGLSYNYSSRFTLKASWAHVIGVNPGRSATDGTDSDGKSDRSRYWLQALMYF